jgi:hypothetical protein
MPKAFPKYLYRYMAFPSEPNSKDARSKIKRMKALFIESKFYMVCPHWFNDPFDGKSALSKDGMNEFYIQELADYGASQRAEISAEDKKMQSAAHLEAWRNNPEIYDKAFSTTETAATDTSEHIGMLSLSKSPDNILMWSHYANGHQGLCVQLKIEHLPNVEQVLYGAVYKNDSPRMTEFLDLKKRSDPEAETELLFARKSKHWKYEQEWRYIHFYPGGITQIVREPLPFPAESISAVIYGCAMKQKHKEQVNNWLSKRKVPLKTYVAVKSLNKYAVTISGLPVK